MNSTVYFADIRRIVAGTIDDLDGNAIITPDGEIVGNSKVAIEDLKQALGCLDILEYQLPPAVDADEDC